MPQILIPIICVVFFALLIGLIVGIRKMIINRALRKFIIPALKEKGFTYQSYKSVGLFSIGDFTRINDDGMEFTFIISNGGSPYHSFYFNVFYTTATGNTHVTAKVNTFLFFIQKIKYSSEL